MLSFLARFLVLSTLYGAQAIAFPSSRLGGFPSFTSPTAIVMAPTHHHFHHHAATVPIWGTSNPPSSSRGGYTVTRRRAHPHGRMDPAYASQRGGQGFDLSNWTNRLLALNTAIFLLQQVYPGITLLGAKNDKLIRMGEYHRLFTPMLLHANLQHLMANSYSMYNIGHFIEPVFGGSTYIALYVISGFCGNAMSFVTNTAPISIGASTAVSGLMGALGFFCIRHREMFNLDGPLRSVFQSVVITGMMGAASRNIDNFGHLGGLLGGVACGMLFGPRLVVVTNQMGQYIGLANLPYLQTALANGVRSLRRRGLLPKGSASSAAASRRNAGPSTRSMPSQSKKEKKGWLGRLGSFFHRGGPEPPYGRGSRAAFLAAPCYDIHRHFGRLGDSLRNGVGGGTRRMPYAIGSPTMMMMHGAGKPFAAHGISFSHPGF